MVDFQLPRAPLTPGERHNLICIRSSKAPSFRISRADFEVACEHLAEADAQTVATIDWGGHDCVYFLDFDGNLLEIDISSLRGRLIPEMLS
jgi:hypothetical protein